MLDSKQKNDLYYVCSLIEFIARKTKNYPGIIVEKIGKEELERLYDVAQVNHCLSFEQVSDEVIEDREIQDGDYDIVGRCTGIVPRYLSIGKLYQRLIVDIMKNEDIIGTLYDLYTSFLSYEIADYNSALYYSGESYLEVCYEEGKIVD